MVVTSIACFQGCLFQRHFNAWTLTSGSSQDRDAEAKNGMIQPLLCSFQVHCRHSGSKSGNDAPFKYYTASFVKEQTEEQRENCTMSSWRTNSLHCSQKKPTVSNSKCEAAKDRYFKHNQSWDSEKIQGHIILLSTQIHRKQAHVAKKMAFHIHFKKAHSTARARAPCPEYWQQISHSVIANHMSEQSPECSYHSLRNTDSLIITDLFSHCRPTSKCHLCHEKKHHMFRKETLEQARRSPTWWECCCVSMLSLALGMTPPHTRTWRLPPPARPQFPGECW